MPMNQAFPGTRKKTSSFLWAGLLGLLLTPCASAIENRPHKTGAGVILGEPTGFTGKFWQGSDRALDAGLAFSFNHFVFFYGDYLFHLKPYQGVLPYVGIGGGFLIYQSDGDSKRIFKTSDSGVGLALRIPVGAEWFVPKAPLGVFVELVPGMGILPSTVALIQGGIGIRYYFDR